MSKPENYELEELGIVIAGEPLQRVSKATECCLTVIAHLPDEDDHQLNSRWIRSLFLTCVSEANQTAGISNLLKGRVIFAGDIKKIPSSPPMFRLALRIKLSEELKRELVPDRYYVQVSARQFLSNLIIVECV